MRISSWTIAILAVLAGTACKGSDADRTATSDTTTSAATDTTNGMGGMGGMAAMASGPMMDSMQSHLQHIQAMPADSMRAALSMHRQMVGNLMTQMNSEMRSMNMTADSSWTALSDSIRQDLIHLPDMRGSALKTAMPAHCARVSRLMEMHKTMAKR
jgi:hypothetical protein